MVNRIGQKSLLGALSLVLAAASSVAIAADSKLTVDSNIESLDSGDTWRVSSVSFGRPVKLGTPVRVTGTLEHEDRRVGSANRVYLDTSFAVTKSATLELGVARATGAVYSFKRQEHAMLYTSVGKVEFAAGVYQSHYAQSTTRRALLQTRVYLPHGFTPILNVASSRSGSTFAGGSVGAGLEYEKGPCIYSVGFSRGHEAEDPAEPSVTQLSSRSSSAGMRCDLTPSVKLKLGTSSTQAGILSRKGVSGALVIAF